MNGSRNSTIPAHMLRIIVAMALVPLLSSACATQGGHNEYQTALGLFRAEKYREAREHALNAYNSDSGEPSYVGLLGWTYFKQNDFAEAGRLFSQVDAQGAKKVIGLQGLAWVSYMLDDYSGAEKRFKDQLNWAELLLVDHDFAYFPSPDKDYIHSIASDAYYGLGLVAAARGRAEEARRLLSRSLGHTNDFIGHGPIRSAIGDVYYQAKDYKNAIAYYQKSLQDKKDDDVRSKLAWSLYFSRDFGGAEGLFSKVAVEAMDKRSSLYGLVLSRVALRQVDKARQSLEELIHLDGYYADTPEMSALITKNESWKALWKEYASFYFQRGDFARAAYKLEGYLPAGKSDCEARMLDAWCTFYLGNHPGALEKFTKLRDEKRCAMDQTETGRGVVLLYLRRLDEADEALIKACRLNKSNLRAALARGAVVFARGDYEAAIAIYKTNLSALPAKDTFFSWPSHALNNLGWSYVRMGRYDEALTAFQRLKSLHTNPTYPQIFDGLGWSYARGGMTKEARSAFETALRLDPEYVSARMGLLSLGDERK